MSFSIEVAQHFLNLAKKDKKPLTSLHIVKLVYMAHGLMLGLHNKRLIEEDVEAWEYGPGIRELYDRVKHTRGQPIKEVLCENPKLEKLQKEIIEKTYKAYKNYNELQLSSINNMEGTPWMECKKEGIPIIPKEKLSDYYRKMEQAS